MIIAIACEVLAASHLHIVNCREVLDKAPRLVYSVFVKFNQTANTGTAMLSRIVLLFRLQGQEKQVLDKEGVERKNAEDKNLIRI